MLFASAVDLVLVVATAAVQFRLTIYKGTTGAIQSSTSFTLVLLQVYIMSANLVKMWVERDDLRLKINWEAKSFKMQRHYEAEENFSRQLDDADAAELQLIIDGSDGLQLSSLRDGGTLEEKIQTAEMSIAGLRLLSDRLAAIKPSAPLSSSSSDASLTPPLRDIHNWDFRSLDQPPVDENVAPPSSQS